MISPSIRATACPMILMRTTIQKAEIPPRTKATGRIMKLFSPKVKMILKTPRTIRVETAGLREPKAKHLHPHLLLQLQLRAASPAVQTLIRMLTLMSTQMLMLRMQLVSRSQPRRWQIW